MSALDPFDRRILDYFESTARGAEPTGLRDRVVQAARANRQHPPALAALRFRLLRIGPAALDREPRSDARPDLARGLARPSRSVRLATVAIVLAVALVAVAVVDRGPSQHVAAPGATGASLPPAASAIVSPTPAPSRSIPPSRSAGPPSGSSGPAMPISVIENGGSLIAGYSVTSRLFEPTVTFQLLDRTPAVGVPDVCMPVFTSRSTIVLAHPHGCVEDIRLIHPYFVACGDAGTAPTVDELAAAIIGRLGPSVVDRGALSTPGTVPDHLFAAPYEGRVLEILGDRPFDRLTVDPDQCHVVPESGSSDPIIEFRGDTPAKLILVDVRGEVVILRIGSAGHDTPSTQIALSRGYGTTLDGVNHLLGVIHDIAFP